MNRLQPIGSALALIMLSWSALAQTDTVTKPTTLQSAVERAILQNPDVNYRFHNFEAAGYELRSAQGAWQPRVDFETGTADNQTQTPSLPAVAHYGSNSASIQLRQTLFDGYATLNDVRRLSHAQQASYYELQSASNQTSLDTVRAYLDVLRYRELVEMAVDNLQNHRQIYAKLEEKVKAGVGRRVDLEQAAGRMALAESNWLTEVSNLHDVSARYQRLVGDIPAATLAPPPAMTAHMPQGIGYLRTAVAQNPDFLAAVATLRSFRSDLNVRKAAMYPTVEFRARHNYDTNESGVMGDYRYTTLELVMTYNLYRGGADSAKIKQYAARFNAAMDLRDKACRDGWQTGQIAYNDSVRLGAQMRLLQQHELSTSKARVAYQQQFDIGQRSLLDLLDTENEYYEARRALTNAEYDLQLAQARVLASSGTLLQALELRPLSEAPDTTQGNAQDDDNLMECSTHELSTITQTPPPALPR